MGADIAARMNGGLTPLQLSIRHGHHQVAQVLRELESTARAQQAAARDQRANGNELCCRPGPAVKLPWPGSKPGLSRRIFGDLRPTYTGLYSRIRNRHWQMPGRHHKKLPNSPGDK
jgi:hypothetical protein